MRRSGMGWRAKIAVQNIRCHRHSLRSARDRPGSSALVRFHHRRMLGLVQTNHTAPWKSDLGHGSPASLLDLGTLNTSVSKCPHVAREVIAHEVQLRPCHLGGMNGELRRRQTEDQPSATGIDVVEAEYVGHDDLGICVTDESSTWNRRASVQIAQDLGRGQRPTDADLALPGTMGHSSAAVSTRGGCTDGGRDVSEHAATVPGWEGAYEP